MAKAATSRIQKSDVRRQNFKASPMATILKIMNNAGELDTPPPHTPLDFFIIKSYNIHNNSHKSDTSDYMSNYMSDKFHTICQPIYQPYA